MEVISIHFFQACFRAHAQRIPSHLTLFLSAEASTRANLGCPIDQWLLEVAFVLVIIIIVIGIEAVETRIVETTICTLGLLRATVVYSNLFRMVSRMCRNLVIHATTHLLRLCLGLKGSLRSLFLCEPVQFVFNELDE